MSDSALQRVAAGEVAAVQECIDRYGGLVWSLARRLCAPRSDAEDAVQEIFIALWEGASSYDPDKGAEVTYVSTIARRKLIDRARKEGRDRDLVSRAAQIREPGLRDERKASETADEVRRALQALSQLDADEQRVVKLAVHFGLTHEAIAQHTGLPLGTVKTRIRRGLLRVRQMLQPAGKDESIGYAP